MQILRFFSGFTLVCGTFLLNACLQSSSAGGSLNLDQQVQQHEMQLRQLQPAQADVWSQVQAMRQELNQIKGQMDDLHNAGGARALADRVNRHDAALRQVENSMALNLNLGDASMPTGSPMTPMYAPAVGIPTASAVTPSSQPQPTYGDPSLPGGAQAPSSATWGQPSPQPVVQAPQKDISLALFDAGVNSYNARNYVEAQRSFSDFLKNYKTHNLISEAQFYLAECQFQRNQFADAALAYDTVIKKYPSSSSTPGAYLKQGICFSKINQGAAAKARMQELIKKFPNSLEAARAKTFLKTNK